MSHATTINTFAIALALCAALAACRKPETAPATDKAAPLPAATTAAPATDPNAAVATAPANTGLPVECERYINRVKACLARSGGNAAAAAFQQSLDQAKAQWQAAGDKSRLVTACNNANTQFAQSAATMKCE